MVNDHANQLIDLQTQLAFQEDLLTSLNDRVYAQDREMQKMQMAISRLSEQLREQNVAAEQGDNQPSFEKPPHY
jgi:SlyX protein